MPFIRVDQPSDAWARRGRRWLINGNPNAGKTNFQRQVPKPCAYVCYPGELGSSAAEIDYLAGDRAWIWEEDDTDPTKINYGEAIKEVKLVTADILAGKYGDFASFYGDGIHKLYNYYLAMQTGGVSEYSADFEARLYGPTHKDFFRYLRRVNQSTIDNVFFTAWAADEKDDSKDKSKDAPSHLMPSLPGRAAKEIMGEFAVVLYFYVKRVGKAEDFLMQTKPEGAVWGCGLKAPQAVAARVPTHMKQDYKALEALLMGAGQKAA